MITKEDIERLKGQKNATHKKTQHTKIRHTLMIKNTYTQIRITLVKVDGQTIRLRLMDLTRQAPTESWEF